MFRCAGTARKTGWGEANIGLLDPRTGLRRTPAGSARPAPLLVALGSPYDLFNLGVAHARALGVLRDIYNLTDGVTAERIDRMVACGAEDADQMFLLRALLLSGPDAAGWAEIWPRFRNHYEIELGTQILLGPTRPSPAVRELFAALRTAKAQISLAGAWSPSLRTVLLDRVGAGRRVATAAHDGALQTPPDIWIGAVRHVDKGADATHILAYGDAFEADTLFRVTETLDAYARVRNRESTGDVVAFSDFT